MLIATKSFSKSYFRRSFPNDQSTGTQIGATLSSIVLVSWMSVNSRPTAQCHVELRASSLYQLDHDQLSASNERISVVFFLRRHIHLRQVSTLTGSSVCVRYISRPCEALETCVILSSNNWRGLFFLLIVGPRQTRLRSWRLNAVVSLPTRCKPPATTSRVIGVNLVSISYGN